MLLVTLSICHYPVTLVSTALSRDHCLFSDLDDAQCAEQLLLPGDLYLDALSRDHCLLSGLDDAQHAEHLSLPGDPYLDRFVARSLPIQ